MPAPLQLHGIPNCDTVKKARAWLTGQGAAHDFVDFKKAAPDVVTLRAWAEAVGIESLLNRKGTTWRALDPADQASADDVAGAVALMQAHSSLIKRPVVRWPDGAISVGFDPAAWAQRLGG